LEYAGLFGRDFCALELPRLQHLHTIKLTGLFFSRDLRALAALPKLTVLVLVESDQASLENLTLLRSLRALQISNSRIEMRDLRLPPNLVHLALINCCPSTPLLPQAIGLPQTIRSVDLRKTTAHMTSQHVTEVVSDSPKLEWLDSFPNVKSLVRTQAPGRKTRRELERLKISWRVGVEPLFPSVSDWFKTHRLE